MCRWYAVYAALLWLVVPGFVASSQRQFGGIPLTKRVDAIFSAPKWFIGLLVYSNSSFEASVVKTTLGNNDTAFSWPVSCTRTVLDLA
jgi:hypothetical protein